MADQTTVKNPERKMLCLFAHAVCLKTWKECWVHPYRMEQALLEVTVLKLASARRHAITIESD
ncbi:MAG: hypothetical protein P8Z67_15345 [Gammaproteobacteria bacterium]